MFPHLLPATHVYRDIGVFIDTAQSIMLVAFGYLLWRIARVTHQLQAVSRFWLERWNGTPKLGGLRAVEPHEVLKEAAGDC